MSVTSVARGRMIYRALIESLEPGATNPDGHPDFEGWVTKHASLPCYIWDRKRVEALELNQTVVVSETRMMVPLGTDVTELDRVNGIVDRLGNSYMPGVFRIRGVSQRATHLELLLQQVQGGRVPTGSVSS